MYNFIILHALEKIYTEKYSVGKVGYCRTINSYLFPRVRTRQVVSRKNQYLQIHMGCEFLENFLLDSTI